MKLHKTGYNILDDREALNEMKKQNHPDAAFRSNPWGFRAKKFAASATGLKPELWDAINNTVASFSGKDYSLSQVNDGDADGPIVIA